MKMIQGLVAATALLAAPAMAAPFNASEMAQAAKAATEAFKDELGATLYASIYALQSTQTRDGGKVKVFYKQNGQNKTLEFFCHYHGSEGLDCHEL